MRYLSLPALLALTTPALANEPPSTPPQIDMQAVEDGSATIAFRGADANGDALSYRIVASPEHGAITWRAGMAIYTPNPNYNGSDAFTYVASDGSVDSLPTQVNVQIRPQQDTVQAEPMTIELDEDDRATFVLQAQAEDGVDIGWELIEGPQAGTLYGEGQMWGRAEPSLVYVPDADFFGTDRIVVAAFDKGSPLPWIMEVPLEVQGVPDAPGSFALTSPDLGAEVTTVRPVLQWSTTRDVDGDALTYSARIWDAVSNETIEMSPAIASDRAVGEYRVQAELAQGGVYGWEVIASDGELESPIAGGGWFSISADNAPPQGLEIVSPEFDEAVGTDTPTIVFQAAMDPEGGTVWHDVEVDIVRDFSSSDRFQAEIPSSGGQEYVDLADYGAGLPRFETAYARVRATDAAGASTPWQTVTFTTGGPNSAPTMPDIKFMNGLDEGQCVWTFSSTDPNADAVQYEVTKTLASPTSTYTSFYEAGSPEAAYLCPRSIEGAAQGVWVRAIDEYGAMSEWAFAEPRIEERTSASCSVSPGFAGLFPMALVLLGVRRRKN